MQEDKKDSTAEKPGEHGTPTQVFYDEHKPILILRSAVIQVVAGPDTGKSCQLQLHRVSVGTCKDNDLVLTDSLVSRHHAEFQVHDQGYLVRDLDSTNGSFFRGARVHEADLGPGAELRIGDTVLRIERGEDCTHSVSTKQAFGSLIGTSRAMQEVFGVLTAVAPLDATVMILGETGTGKELVAEELHQHSPRRNHNFIIVDCGSIPSTLIESELFGHVKGSFTGALTDKAGAFEKASGGTIFLDEIGELPLGMQTRLLRVLDKRTIKRVGGLDPISVDIRVVAATNRDLEQLVAEEKFRKDLFYRLNVIHLRLPSLRERREDIPLIARHLLWKAGCPNPNAVLSSKVMEVLATRQWPGNVRELRNVIERAMVLSDGAVLQLGSAPDITPSSAVDSGGPAPDALTGESWLGRAMPKDLLNRPYKVAKEVLLQQFEFLFLNHLLDRHGDNIKRIAEDAGVDRALIRKLLRKHGLRSET